MEPPWIIKPDYFADGSWILGDDAYLEGWRKWFVALPENQQADYQKTYPATGDGAAFYGVFGVPPYDPAREAEKFRDVERLLVPPWRAFPKIGLGSIGWRMGPGEDYWFAFADWYKSLDAYEKIALREKYPEPAEVNEGHPWTGFYDRLEKY